MEHMATAQQRPLPIQLWSLRLVTQGRSSLWGQNKYMLDGNPHHEQ